MVEFKPLTNQIAIRRTLTELKKISSDAAKKELARSGIFFYPEPDKLGLIRVLLIGASDTPYEGGFYFFTVVITDEFPYSPPVVTYHTQYNSFRFNPNLYQCGKVCLSILGTWAGPGWTVAMSLESIFQAIISLVLIKDPLRNEPAYSHFHRDNPKHQGDIDSYTMLVEHEVFRGAILSMLEQVPTAFACFQAQIREYFKENYQAYTNRLNTLMPKHGKHVLSRYACINMQLNYAQIKSEVEEVYAKYA